ncbi:MAG: InlB B-repeat-containing protein, partial [Oscillospiraceae bacterium]|nr:InlB B-repeat-containing protein [Oscillospiraceae bacterium]
MKRKFLSILLTAVILITLVPLTGIKNEQAQTNAFASTAFTTTPMLSTGSSHTTALKSDGTVWTWGNNGYSGKLGDGTNTNKNTPVQVQNLTNVIFVSTISHHIVALKSDGTVWAWGNNEYGQLGDDTNTNKNTPVQVQNLTNVIAVSAGHSFTAALKSDGTVWAWGRNLRGQLGDGTNIDKNTPVQVQNLTNVDAFSVGYNHTTALKSDGTVWAWGDNYFGPLGDGTNINKNTPVQVQNLTNVIAVSAGAWHTTALKSDGTVWAWGENEHGSLGDGTNIDKNTPVQVQNLTNIIAVSAGAWHTTALKSDGTIWAWGQNHMGQLGDGTTTNKNTSVQVQSLTNIDAVSAGHYFTAALKSDGTVWAWGDNEYGQLGDGTNTNKNTPVQVLGENGILYFNLYGFMINATAETGGTVSGSGVFAPNATVTLLAATDAGYVFDGWYSGSTRVTANTIFIFNATENRVLEARFIKTFTINAVAGPDGTVSGGGVFNQNAAVTLTATANSGFIFDGWYSGSTRVSINSIYTFFVTENRTLQARFSKTTYAVTYNANSGSGAPSPQTKTHGETLIISSTRPTRTGYDFLGWAHAGTATTAQYQPGDFYTVDANGTLYAVWQPSTYTVTYNANNGTGAPSPQTKTHGVTLTISSTRPTRTGYNFLGWATSSTATTAQYQPGGSYTANENLTLYAVWQRITYNITATALTGGTVSGGGVFNQNAAVTLTATANAGYTFDGWFSGNTRVSANWIYTFNATANRTLQARFIQNQNQYTINVIAGTGGKASGGGT